MSAVLDRPSAAGPGGAGPGAAGHGQPSPTSALGNRRAAAWAPGALLAAAAVALTATGLLPVPVLVLSLPFLYLVAARPVLRRLAVRSALRRPRETALVVLGSLLGTAIITGSFVVGDTLDSSIRRSAVTQLGPVDEVVVGAGASAAGELAGALAGLPADQVDGVLPAVSVTAAVAARQSDGDGGTRAEPAATVYELDFDAARSFGGDEGATGIDGPTPAAGEAAVGRDLADELGVDAGDRIELFAYGDRVELTVARVLPRLGLAGLHVQPEGSESPTLFVAPGTIQGLAAAAGPDRLDGPDGLDRADGGTPPQGLVLVSNRGGVEEGADGTDAAVAAIRQALGGRPADVREAKADLLDAAEAQGEGFATTFASIGFFSVLAGVLLLVNMFVALAQERKRQLGVLRAVGLRRSSLVASFSLEGWLYALAAGAVGTLLGIGVGRLIVVVAAGIFGQGDASLELSFSATLASVQTGFTIGFVIAVVTVVASSLGIARLNVIRAIRDLPEPDAGRRDRLVGVVAGVVLLLAGAALTATGVSGEQAYPLLGGPGVAALGAVLALRRLVPHRLLVSAASLAVVAWAVVAFTVFPEVFQGVDIPIFVLQGVLLTAASVSLVTVNQDAVGAALRRVGGGSRSMALRLGLAYPLARRFRTSMILAMYVLVVFTLTFILVLSNLFATQIDEDTADLAGGYDLVVRSNPAAPVPADELRAWPGVDAVAEVATAQGEFDLPGRTDGFEPWTIGGVDAGWSDRGRGLVEVGPGYADARQVWEAVARDPSLVVVSEFFLQSGGSGPPEAAVEPGTQVTLRDPLSGRSRQLTVAGLAHSSYSEDPAYMSRQSVDELFGGRVAGDVHLAVAPGTDPDRLVDDLNGQYLANGADAETFRSVVDENLGTQLQFFRLLQGYLALGLVVGVAGLGVVAVRAVRERTRQVGVLRALGFGSAAVRRAFLAESAFVALEGILLGVVLALVTAWRLFGTGSLGEGVFTVPWVEVAVLVTGTLVASLLATVAPAQQASRIRPAVALRTAD